MTGVLFGIDYRDLSGALAHIKPADIKSFQGGKSFVIEYIGVAQGQGNAALTAADVSALESQGLDIVSVYENRPPGQPGMSDSDATGCPFRKSHPRRNSRRKAESSHHFMRCLQSCTPLECSPPTCSSRGGGLKPRTFSFAIKSALLCGARRLVCGCAVVIGRCWYGSRGFGPIFSI